MTSLDQFLIRAEALLARVEAILPQAVPAPDWNSFAFRWRRRPGALPCLQAVAHVSHIAFDDLHNIGTQKAQIEQNTRQFVSGRPANNVLLTGARGTGGCPTGCIVSGAVAASPCGTAHAACCIAKAAIALCKACCKRSARTGLVR